MPRAGDLVEQLTDPGTGCRRSRRCTRRRNDHAARRPGGPRCSSATDARVSGSGRSSSVAGSVSSAATSGAGVEVGGAVWQGSWPVAGRTSRRAMNVSARADGTSHAAEGRRPVAPRGASTSRCSTQASTGRAARRSRGRRWAGPSDAAGASAPGATPSTSAASAAAPDSQRSRTSGSASSSARSNSWRTTPKGYPCLEFCRPGGGEFAAPLLPSRPRLDQQSRFSEMPGGQLRRQDAACALPHGAQGGAPSFELVLTLEQRRRLCNQVFAGPCAQIAV